ncbi:MAG: nucleotidyltransferase domain-containing protein [Pirellulales bacterium]
MLRDFCSKWKIREFALFGSALRDDFRPDSDVDVLVTFADEAAWGLWDVVKAEEELRDLVGRPVDLVDRRTIENSENWIRRREILGAARTIYGG